MRNLVLIASVLTLSMLSLIPRQNHRSQRVTMEFDGRGRRVNK